MNSKPLFPKLQLEDRIKTLLGYYEGVLLGSRALGVCTDNSDWDIAILRANLPEFVRDSKEENITMYVEETTPFSNHALVQFPHLDVMIFETKEELEELSTIMDTLRKVPSCILEDKQMRIDLFRFLLSKSPSFEKPLISVEDVDPEEGWDSCL